MSRWYGYNGIEVSRDDLIAFAWSAPMRTLAAKVGMSDVGLRKMLTSIDVFPPPQGYWNKLAAGKPVPKRPIARERKPGETPYVRVDNRLGVLVPQATMPDHRGPFATKFVPEDLEELYQSELKSVGNVKATRDLSNPHRGLQAFLQSEQKRQAKKDASEYSWTDGARFDNPFDKRRLRILNGLFHALDRRNASGHCSDQDADIHASVTVGDNSVSISIEPVGTKRAHGYSRISRYAELSANTKLRLLLNHSWKSSAPKTWVDTDKKTVEQSLNEVAASIIMLGEAAYRRSLQEHARWLEEQQKRKVEAQRQRLAEAEAERLVQLRKSGELLRQAQEVRSLIALVKEASGDLDVGTSDRESWEKWAHDYADRIDPVKSGQVLLHLLPPIIEDP